MKRLSLIVVLIFAFLIISMPLAGFAKEREHKKDLDSSEQMETVEESESYRDRLEEVSTPEIPDAVTPYLDWYQTVNSQQPGHQTVSTLTFDTEKV